MDKEKEPETTWDRISHLSLPNQVQALCMCIDELVLDKYKAPPEETKKPPKP